MTAAPPTVADAADAARDPAAAAAILAPTLPVASRARARIVVAALAVAVWMLSWRSDGTTGPELTGAAALLGFVAVWGLAATTLLAHTRRGLLVGEAVTSAAFAAAMTALVMAPHPWLPRRTAAPPASRSSRRSRPSACSTPCRASAGRRSGPRSR